jgi:hypothetical protein
MYCVSGLRITPDREWFSPGDITADLAEVNAGSAQLFPSPGFLTANCSRSTGLTPPGDSVPVAVWKIPQFQAARRAYARTLTGSALQSAANTLMRVSRSWPQSFFAAASPMSCSGSPTAGRGIDRYEFVVAADKEITGVKVTMKKDGALLRVVAARDGIGEGDDSVLMPPQRWTQCAQVTGVGRDQSLEPFESGWE